MGLSDEELRAHMAEILLVETLTLEPEQHAAIGTTLAALRWLKLLCEKESKPITEITAQLVIEKLSGKAIQPEDIASAIKKASELELESCNKAKTPK